MNSIIYYIIIKTCVGIDLRIDMGDAASCAVVVIKCLH